MSKEGETTRLLENELSNWGGFSYQIKPRGKHRVLELTRGETARKIFFSLTPSDRRAGLNMLSFVRRQLAEIGAVKY